MTLILNQATDRFVLQVSDRLVTRNGIAFDPIANKTVVFRAKDAVMVMSYTGDSYVGNIPTDSFIAEVLSGWEFERQGRPGMMIGGMKAPLLDLQSTLRLLERRLGMELRAPYTIRTRALLFEVLISGWEWGNGVFPRPFTAWIRKEPGQREARLAEDRRLVGNGFAFSYTPESALTKSEIPEVRARLRDTRSPSEAERVFVETIREVATRSTYVGPNCMSVVLPRPTVIGEGKSFIGVSLVPANDSGIRVRFIGVDVPNVVAQSPRTQTKDVVGRGAFSPWIVGPGGAIQPSILTGRPSNPAVLGITLTVEGAPATGGVHHAMSGIMRPSVPR